MDIDFYITKVLIDTIRATRKYGGCFSAVSTSRIQLGLCVCIRMRVRNEITVIDLSPEVRRIFYTCTFEVVYAHFVEQFEAALPAVLIRRFVSSTCSYKSFMFAPPGVLEDKKGKVQIKLY